MAKTILLVDDDTEPRDILGRIIERRGFTVFKAANGKEAIEFYKEHKPDCVFLDIRLPDMDGHKVLEQLKQINPKAKVYFVTGVMQEIAFKDEVANLGAAGYLEKPIDLETIIKILDNL